MATDYPGAIDSSSKLPNPSASSATNSPSHAGLHDNENDAIIATETKLGTGASTPTNNTLLIGTGTGTSSWSAVTSAQLAARISDETGSGSAVFGTTPTLVTPKVDTINESTLNNGTTIGGVNIKSGALNTNNSVVTANITDSAVTGSKLATSAIKLGYTSITSSYTPVLSDNTYGDVTSLSATVTVPAGGRDVEIVVSLPSVKTDGPAGTAMSVAVRESTTILGQYVWNQPVANYNVPILMSAYVLAPSAGSHTYKVSVAKSSGNITVAAGTAATTSTQGAAFILVKAI